MEKRWKRYVVRTSTKKNVCCLLFSAKHVLASSPSDPTPLAAFVVFKLALSGTRDCTPTTLAYVSRKWFESPNLPSAVPAVRLSVQGKAGLVTSNAVSQTFENSIMPGAILVLSKQRRRGDVPSMMYGAALASALLSINDTNLLPVSIKVPNVGHWSAVTATVSGAYDKSTRLAVVYAAENEAAGWLSMLTMRMETTSVGLLSIHVLTFLR